MKHCTRFCLLYSLWLILATHMNAEFAGSLLSIPDYVDADCVGAWVSLLLFLACSLSLAFPTRRILVKAVPGTFVVWIVWQLILEIQGFRYDSNIAEFILALLTPVAPLVCLRAIVGKPKSGEPTPSRRVDAGSSGPNVTHHFARLVALYAMWVVLRLQWHGWTWLDKTLPFLEWIGLDFWLQMLAFLACGLSLAFVLQGRRILVVGLTFLWLVLLQYLVWLLFYTVTKGRDPLGIFWPRHYFSLYVMPFIEPLVPLAIAFIAIRRHNCEQSPAGDVLKAAPEE